MLAKPVSAIPPGQLYEPKWDGFRAIVFRDGDAVEIGSRNGRTIARYFPELVDAARAHLPRRCVVDGEIVVADAEGRLDFFALQQRIHPAERRINLLAAETPARFVAFDLLALGDADLTGEPFTQRRARLADALGAAGPDAPVHLCPLTDDEDLAAVWFERFEGAGLDGVIAKRADLRYQPDKRVMAKIKHVRTADCVVTGYRLHRSSRDAVGSLLLGLYDDGSEEIPDVIREGADGPVLVPVGVIGAFPMAVRRQLVDELAPLVTDFADHPWRWVPDMLADRPASRMGNRWNAGKDQSFVPLRPERVVEVRYDYMEGFRFRHVGQFVRWRPDRDPASCTYAQIERPAPCALDAVLTPPGP